MIQQLRFPFALYCLMMTLLYVSQNMWLNKFQLKVLIFTLFVKCIAVKSVTVSLNQTNHMQDISLDK
jgi:hypothetical protein